MTMLPVLALTALLLAQDAALSEPPPAPLLSINPLSWPGPGWIATAWSVPSRVTLPKGDSLPLWQQVGWTVPGGWAHLTGDRGEICAHRGGTISRASIPGLSGMPPDGWRVWDGSRWVDGLGLVLLSGWSGYGWTRGLVAVWDGSSPAARTWWTEGFLPGAVELVRPGLLALTEAFQAEPVTALGMLDLETGQFWRPETGPSLRWGRGIARVGSEVWVSAYYPDGIQVYDMRGDPRWLRTIPCTYLVEAFLVRQGTVYSRSPIHVDRRNLSGEVIASLRLPVPEDWATPPYSLVWDDRDGGRLIGQVNVAHLDGPWLLCYIDPDLSGRYEAPDLMPGIVGPIHPWRRP